jgi:polyhydroxyalkanoate synthesis regulator protein
MAVQPPAMQHMMSNYFDQSKSILTQMQETMQKQAETFFPGMAGFTPPTPPAKP